jgi:hypothetical protein
VREARSAIRNPRLHCWCNSKRRMGPAHIVISKVKRGHYPYFSDLLRGLRQEPPFLLHNDRAGGPQRPVTGGQPRGQFFRGRLFQPSIFALHRRYQHTRWGSQPRSEILVAFRYNRLGRKNRPALRVTHPLSVNPRDLCRKNRVSAHGANRIQRGENLRTIDPASVHYLKKVTAIVDSRQETWPLFSDNFE